MCILVVPMDLLILLILLGGTDRMNLGGWES
jgi:hypothetical protein